MSSRSHHDRTTSHYQRDNRYYDDSPRHYLPIQDHHSRTPRQRSPAPVRYPYTSNCGRRRWPPSPKVEEVRYEEEIPMRGKIGQDPMIIDVPYSTSSDSGSTFSKDSDSSLGPETPPTDNDNRDRRYVWKPEPDIPIPQAYDDPKDSKRTTQKDTIGLQDQERGRRKTPKLDTDFARNNSTGGSLTLERERSPYASGPQDRKPKPERLSGEYLLSPDVMSPRKAYAESPRSQSYFPRPGEARASGRQDQRRELPRQPRRPSMESHRAQSHYIPRPAQVQVHNHARDAHDTNTPRVSARPSLDRRATELPYPDNPTGSGKRSMLDSESSKRPVRPPVDRRASPLPYPITPPSASGNAARSKHPHGSLEDSDSDHVGSRANSGQASPTTPRYPTTTSSKNGRHHERKFSSELPATPLKRSVPSSDATGPPVNLSSLVSGAAITQTLNAMLNGDHTAARRASPRPSPLASPHGSPKTSPHPSPPRTPPADSLQHRANPIVGLKKDSPSSIPSSPLSSRSSIWTAEPAPSPHDGGKIIKPRPGPPKSRNTAPLPGSHAEGPKEPELLAAPGIVVRSPSPAKHAKSFSAESREPQHSRAGEGSRDEAPEHHTRSSDPRLAGSSGRQRSASSVDVRPQLSVNPGPFRQASDAPASPRLSTPSDRYKPSKLEPDSPATRSRSSRPEDISSNSRTRSRSRSYVPESTFSRSTTQSSSLDPRIPAPRSRSTMPVPTPSSARSRSSGPKPTSQSLVPIPPGSLPICPRPKAVAGYDDWSTFHDNTTFAICPSCRDSVFGPNHSQYLQPRPEVSRKTLCDLNNPWVRLALSLRGPDVKILSTLSDVTYEERSCPGDDLAPRNWYRLEDPDSGKHISGFNACPHCVHSLEALLPAWRNVFYRTRSSNSHDLKERFCGLRANPHRFGDYLNMMVESAQEADVKRKEPNTAPVRELAKQLANIDDCPKDAMFARKAWHIHPHLPEFTICQDCYENVVYPLAKQGMPIAAKIDKKPHQSPNPEKQVCCHLYSKRMRKVFTEACEDNDYEHLRHTVLKRHMLQQDILGTFSELNDHPKDREVDDRLRELLAKWKEKE